MTTFDAKELDEIQKGCMKLLLPKMGINRNMPRSVIFGPRCLGGRQIMDQKIEQPAISYKTTLGHMRRNDNAGKALLITLQDPQIEIGTEEPFFYKDPEVYHYGTDKTRWKYTPTFSGSHCPTNMLTRETEAYMGSANLR